jgi:hypothetical protein
MEQFGRGLRTPSTGVRPATLLCHGWHTRGSQEEQAKDPEE